MTSTFQHWDDLSKAKGYALALYEQDVFEDIPTIIAEVQYRFELSDKDVKRIEEYLITIQNT